MIVNFNVIEHIVINDSLLTRVETFLRGEGQDHLADMVNKLQQDAGLKYADSMGDGTGVEDATPSGICRVKQFVDQDNLPITNPLIDGYEDIPPSRLQVFDLIQQALPVQDAGYTAFMDRLRLVSQPVAIVYGTAPQPPGL